MKAVKEKCYGHNNIKFEGGEFRMGSYCDLSYCPWCGEKLNFNFLIDRLNKEMELLNKLKADYQEKK